jgi:hypothetical protein
VDQAIEAATKALARAQQIDHAMTTGFALIFSSTLCEFMSEGRSIARRPSLRRGARLLRE